MSFDRPHHGGAPARVRPGFARTEILPARPSRAGRLLRILVLAMLLLGLTGALVVWATVGLGPLAPLAGSAFESRAPDPAALADATLAAVGTAAAGMPGLPDAERERRTLPTDQEHALRIAELETRRAGLEAEVEALAEARRTAHQTLDELLALRREELTAIEDLQLRQRALAEEIDDLEARRAELLRSPAARPPPGPATPVTPLPPAPEVALPAPGAGPELEPLVASDPTLLEPPAAADVPPAPGPLATADAGRNVLGRSLLAGPRAGAAPAAGATGRRVFIHYSTLQEGAEALARRIADQLTARGFTVPELRPKPFAISATRIRFFFDEDREAAPVVQDVVTALQPGASAAGDARIQDFTHYTPKPPPRTLELWLMTGSG